MDYNESLKVKIKSKWSKLSDSDIEELQGNLNGLPAKVQRAYGKPKDVVEREVAEFRKTLSDQSGFTSVGTSTGNRPKNAGV